MEQLLNFSGLQLEITNLITLLNNENKTGTTNSLFEHFEFIKQFDYDGAQGKVGLLKHKKTGKLVVYKVPLSLGYQLRQEALVYHKLKGIRSWCPHFCEGFGTIKTLIYPDNNRKINPFLDHKELGVFGDVLLCEYIPGSKDLTSRILTLSTARTFSIIRQLIVAIEIAYRKFGLIHYDLHTDNILLTDCDQEAIFLYNLGTRRICVPTHGIVPVVIDYGFSYVKGSDTPLYCPMEVANGGYLGCIADPFYDLRILLINITAILEKKDSSKYGKICADLRSLYKGLDYDPVCGWDRQSYQSATDIVLFRIEELEQKNCISAEMSKHTESYVLLFQSLIKLPLHNKKNGDITDPYLAVAKEFAKLEQTARTSFSKLYLMYTLVDAARKARQLYISDSEAGIREFRQEFSDQILLSFKFYTPPAELDYTILLTNLYELSDRIGTIYYRVLKDNIAQKKSGYAKTTLKKNLEIHDYIESKYTTEYNLTPVTPVYLWDTVTERHLIVKKFRPADCEHFNSLGVTERAEWLWNCVTEMNDLAV